MKEQGKEERMKKNRRIGERMKKEFYYYLFPFGSHWSMGHP
jgi:hypothetical protein